MTLIEKSITTNAPAEHMWEMLENMSLQSELNPNLNILSHTPAPVGGHNTMWEEKYTERRALLEEAAMCLRVLWLEGEHQTTEENHAFLASKEE